MQDEAMRRALHIGDGITLSPKEIIGIFKAEAGNGLLMDKFRAGFLARNMSDKNRTFILAGSDKKCLLYFSKISAGRLIKRALNDSSGGLDGKES